MSYFEILSIKSSYFKKEVRLMHCEGSPESPSNWEVFDLNDNYICGFSQMEDRDEQRHLIHLIHSELRTHAK